MGALSHVGFVVGLAHVSSSYEATDGRQNFYFILFYFIIFYNIMRSKLSGLTLHDRTNKRFEIL